MAARKKRKGTKKGRKRGTKRRPAKRRAAKRKGSKRKGSKRKGSKRKGSKRKKRGGSSKMVCPKAVDGKPVTASKGRCWIIIKTQVPKVRTGPAKKRCVAKKFKSLRAQGIPAVQAHSHAKSAC